MTMTGLVLLKQSMGEASRKKAANLEALRESSGD
jgi:hypothetical protein